MDHVGGVYHPNHHLRQRKWDEDGELVRPVRQREREIPVPGRVDHDGLDIDPGGDQPGAEVCGDKKTCRRAPARRREGGGGGARREEAPPATPIPSEERGEDHGGYPLPPLLGNPQRAN